MKKYLSGAVFMGSALVVTLCLRIPSLAQPGQTSPDAALRDDRNKIDSLDRGLLHIIGERERIVQRIGRYKAQHHIPSLQTTRFQDVMARAVKDGAKEGLSAEVVQELFTSIHKESLRLEEAAKTKPKGQP